MWAYDLAFLIVGGRKHFRERAPTSVAEEVVVRRTDLPLLTVWQNSRLAACALQPACILQNGSAAACDDGGEKRKPGLAGLSTSSSCAIAREQPTIGQLPMGETS